jgi:putative endopeptidase
VLKQHYSHRASGRGARGINVGAVFLLVVWASTALAQTPAASQSNAEVPIAPPIVKNLDLSAIDKSADPCTDFYQYACGNWVKDNPIPGDQVRWVRSFSLLQERNLYELWQQLDRAAKNPAGPLEKKYGDFFAACMNVGALDRKGLESVEPALKRVSALNDSKGIATLIGELAAAGDPAPPFHLDVEPDPKDSSKHILTISESGLTLPDRQHYVGDRAFVRKRYQNHVVRMFMLAGDTLERAETEAAAVLGIETALARAATSRADSSDPEKRYHTYTFVDLQKLAPDFDFRVYFEHVTAAPIETLNVANPTFLKMVNGLLAAVPVDSWRSYFRWHILSEQAEGLSKAFRDEDFTFWGSNLTRQEKPTPRWKQCTAITDQAFGDGIAQDWVKRNFPPEAKAGMEALVGALEKALADEIRTLPWMSDETKKTAERKLAAIVNRIGYPERWRDYSGLRVDPSDFLGNSHRNTVFQRDYWLSKAGKPVDTDEWDPTPATADVRYMPSMDRLLIPAGIIQPPFFDHRADPGVNFGGIGAVVGHELTHGFDDLGSKFDERGNVREWQTPDDRKNFAEKASCEVAEYSQFGAMPDPDDLPHLKVNGELTLAENIADNGGLRIAFRALTEALVAQRKTADNKIDGYTQSQRFFLSFAQLWCQNQTLYSARQSRSADPSAPGRWRVNGTVQNFEEFGKAFKCARGRPMYPEKSCRVW